MIRRLKIKVVLLLTLFGLISHQTNAQEFESQQYNPDIPKIESNPMKGLMPSYAINSDLPYSVDHFYIRLNQVITGFDLVTEKPRYNWDAFEDLLVKKTIGGRTVVPRFWTYYPGKTQPVGVPQYLINNGLVMYDVTGGTNKCPEWNDQNLLNCFLDFIEEFADRYDGDPRIIMIEAGLYGSWGEWNTSNTPSGVTGMAIEGRDQIANKYLSEFTKTHVAIRRPSYVSQETIRTNVGYYDDSWGYTTLTPDGADYFNDWRTMSFMKKYDLLESYKYHPFAGEVRPEIQSAIFDSWNPSPATSPDNNAALQDIIECINQTHVSFIRCNKVYSNIPTSTEKENAIKMIKMMGYEFYVNEVKLATDQSNTITAQVRIKNNGIAPVYYNWDVEFAALDNNNNFTVLGTTDWNITTMYPDPVNYYEKSFSANLPDNAEYQILMRFVNPLEGNFGFTDVMQLRFANAKQDEHKDGWLTLGAVNGPALSASNFEKENILLYPNPVKDVLHVDMNDTKPYTLSLINVLGKVILNTSNLNGKNSFNVKDFNAGIYFVRITTETAQTMQKIIIK